MNTSLTTGAASLGINYEIAVTPPGRLMRWIMQGAAAEFLPDRRVALCMRLPVPSADGVALLQSVVGGYAHYGNLGVCGSVWHCPICAAKVTERRASELMVSYDRWIKEGHYAVMVAYTVSHSIDDSIGRVNGWISAASRHLHSGKRWQTLKARYGIVGTIAGTEITYGGSGWHVHRHVMYWLNRPLDRLVLAGLEGDLGAAWRHEIEKAGGFADVEHGCVLSVPEDYGNYTVGLVEYICKWGLVQEVTKSNQKRGRGGSRSVWQLLLDASYGDYDARAAWLEYADYFHGRRQLVYSDGLRALIGLGDYKTDTEIAAAKMDHALLLGILTRDAWRRVVTADRRGQLLDVVDRYGLDGLFEFLDGLGVGFDGFRASGMVDSM